VAASRTHPAVPEGSSGPSIVMSTSKFVQVCLVSARTAAASFAARLYVGMMTETNFTATNYRPATDRYNHNHVRCFLPHAQRLAKELSR
jgi:hypothetical protein